MAKNQSEENKKINPVMASLAGAALGAAVGAGAIILSDKKNRTKLEKVMGELREQGFKVMDIVQREAEVVRNLSSTAKKSPPKKAKKKATKK